jgi:hypothetical protein
MGKVIIAGCEVGAPDATARISKKQKTIFICTDFTAGSFFTLLRLTNYGERHIQGPLRWHWWTRLIEHPTKLLEDTFDTPFDLLPCDWRPKPANIAACPFLGDSSFAHRAFTAFFDCWGCLRWRVATRTSRGISSRPRIVIGPSVVLMRRLMCWPSIMFRNSFG